MYKYVSLTMQYITSLLSSLLPPSSTLKHSPKVSVRQYGSIIRIDLPAQQKYPDIVLLMLDLEAGDPAVGDGLVA